MSISILVVDDNIETTRAYNKALLRKINTKSEDFINVESANTVLVALEKLKSKSFDILVVDLKILGSSGDEWGGLELITESMSLDQLRPIIAISGYGTVELVRKTLKQGVFDFIEKSGTAVDDLVQAVQKAIDTRYEKIRRSGNPFTPMTGIEPTIFGGRTKELEFFEQKIYRALHTKYCEHFLILGEWGIGKSTLLKEYKKICQSRGYIASLVTLEPLQSGASTMDAARSVVEGILRDLPYQVNRFKKVVNFFDSLGITVLGTGLQFKRNTSIQEISAQAFLYDSLNNLWQDLEKDTDVLVILIDDLENFMLTSEIIMVLKSTLSMDSLKNTKILIGLATTTSSWLTFTSIEKHHPLSRYFLSRVELKPMLEEEMLETIRTSLLNTGVSFSSEVMKRIFEHTEGHPFEMQLLCWNFFNNQLSGKVDIDVWEKALQDTLNDIGVAVFERWLEQATEPEIEIIDVIAKSSNLISFQDICNDLMNVNPSLYPELVEQHLKTLLERKLVTRKGKGLYKLSDPLFYTYMQTR